jgi:membrane-associated HD superfamily phosphohydrolase
MKPHLPLINRGTKKSSEKSESRLAVDPRRAALAVMTVAALSALLSLHLLPGKVNLKVGDVSPETILAHRTVRYRDTIQTELRRAQAAASAGRVYDPVPNAVDQAVGTLKSMLRAIENVRREKAGLSAAHKIAHVRGQLGSLLGTQVSDQTLKVLFSVDPDTLRQIEDDALRIVSTAMSKEIREDPADIRRAHKEIAEEAYSLTTEKAVARAVAELSQASIRPNQIYNEERTRERQERAKAEVPPTYGLIVRGEPVISKGERVLPEHIEKFRALGLTHPRLDWQSVACTTAFVALVVALVTLYLWRYYPEVHADTKTLLLIALIVLLSTLALRIGGSMLGIPLSQAQVGYLAILWVVVAGMFLSVLISQQIAVLITALLSIVVSMILNNELRYASSAFLMSLVGI